MNKFRKNIFTYNLYVIYNKKIYKLKYSQYTNKIFLIKEEILVNSEN